MCVCLRASTPIVEDDQDIGESNASVTIDDGCLRYHQVRIPSLYRRKSSIHSDGRSFHDSQCPIVSFGLLMRSDTDG